MCLPVSEEPYIRSKTEVLTYERADARRRSDGCQSQVEAIQEEYISARCSTDQATTGKDSLSRRNTPRLPSPTKRHTRNRVTRKTIIPILRIEHRRSRNRRIERLHSAWRSVHQRTPRVQHHREPGLDTRENEAVDEEIRVGELPVPR